ncbi:MAG TPA: AmmeMemoRadiSam system protein B [Candidatus Binatia bacterium]|nr:AmmeMemoRadiSam system protein B [Candidatus Binatia bacterium]
MRVQSSHLAGRWYEAGAEALARQTDALLSSAGPVAIDGVVQAIVVPHAAYQYSGPTAAVAYAAVRSHAYRRAVILAPSHFLRYRGAATVDVDAFATPLGLVAVDRDAARGVADTPVIHDEPRAYRDEHSLEIQLPLLQRALPDTAIVPFIIGELDDADRRAFAERLDRLVHDADTLLIVSSDFTHYGAAFDYLPFPPTDAEDVSARLRALDMEAIEYVLAGDVAGFQRFLGRTDATICGRVPLSALLAWRACTTTVARPGALLAYTTSLALTGDFAHSVSYAALAFTRAN